MDTVYTASRLPGSFGGVRNLQRYSGQSEGEVKKFLAAQDAYTLHKPRRIRFPRRKTCSKGIISNPSGGSVESVVIQQWDEIHAHLHP